MQSTFLLQILLTMLESSRKANDSLSVEMVHLKQLTDLQKADMETRESNLKAQVSRVTDADHMQSAYL